MSEEHTVELCECNGKDWSQLCSCGSEAFVFKIFKIKVECIPPHDGKRKLVPSEPSQSNPLLKMENLFTAPGEHISQCRIKTGGKKKQKKNRTGTYITLHDCVMTTRGILQEKIILTGFDEKGNSY